MRNVRMGAMLTTVLANFLTVSVAFSQSLTILPLTDEQKLAIYQAVTVRKQSPDPLNSGLYAGMSAIVPLSIPLEELPNELRAEIPHIRHFQFVVTDDKVLLVDPVDRTVATVID